MASTNVRPESRWSWCRKERAEAGRLRLRGGGRQSSTIWSERTTRVRPADFQGDVVRLQIGHRLAVRCHRGERDRQQLDAAFRRRLLLRIQIRIEKTARTRRSEASRFASVGSFRANESEQTFLPRRNGGNEDKSDLDGGVLRPAVHPSLRTVGFDLFKSVDVLAK